jgi:hypothetical protein
MLGSEKYKQFAADCIRIAEKLGCEDKERLLKIADAWTERALEVERQQKKSGDRVNEIIYLNFTDSRVSISIHQFQGRCFH